MPRRTYDNSLRKQAEADTIHRIVQATVELHARQGAMATSHADIAAQAGVSVPTVYKHFPTREALIPHCTGLVAESAPELDVGQLLGLEQWQDRVAALVGALHARYAHFHPWMRWAARDIPALPVLAQILEEGQLATRNAIHTVLHSCSPTPLPDETLAVVSVLLGYPAWQQATEELGNPERAGCVIEQAVRLILSHTIARHKET